MAFVHNITWWIVRTASFCSSHHVRCFMRHCSITWSTTVPSSADAARTSLVRCSHAVTVIVAASDVARWMRAFSVGILWDFWKKTHRFVLEYLGNIQYYDCLNKVESGCRVSGNNRMKEDKLIFDFFKSWMFLRTTWNISTSIYLRALRRQRSHLKNQQLIYFVRYRLRVR